jgi:hypothetical protein
MSKYFFDIQNKNYYFFSFKKNSQFPFKTVASTQFLTNFNNKVHKIRQLKGLSIEKNTLLRTILLTNQKTTKPFTIEKSNLKP